MALAEFAYSNDYGFVDVELVDRVSRIDIPKNSLLSDAIIKEPLPSKFNKFKKSNIEAFYYWNEIQKLM